MPAVRFGSAAGSAGSASAACDGSAVAVAGRTAPKAPSGSIAQKPPLAAPLALPLALRPQLPPAKG